MAEGGGDGMDDQSSWTDNMDNLQEQEDEIMALESIFGETDSLRVISRPGEEKKGLFHLEIDVEVQLQEDGIMVQTWVPYEHDCDSPEKIVTKLNASMRPDFKRSESGRRWHSTFILSHLTPITLSVRLPQSYPSDGAPGFNLSCLWLDGAELSVLCESLDKLWMDSLGMPVIYSWVDLLQNETLSTLCMETSVKLIPYEADGIPYDSRALPECQNVQDDLITMTVYADQRQKEEFVNREHECGICFMEYPGRQFHRLCECKHHFCIDCIDEYCKMHVTEGTVLQLRCPDRECKSYLPPGLLQMVLGEENYMRWERLCLQRALETMDDIEWCPRCNAAVIVDSDGNQAYCTNCSYSFCPRCNDAFHGSGICVSARERLAKVEDELGKLAKKMGMDPSDVKEVVSDVALDKLDKSDKLRLRKLQEEFLSKSLLKKMSKPCPSCKAPIDKFAGCNKVNCSNCRKNMCWVCGKAISGYDHFSHTSCPLFEVPGHLAAEPPIHLRNRQIPAGAQAVNNAIRDGMNEALIKCTRCGNRNVRNGRNNHVKCWACKTNICFQCKKPITGLVSIHFSLAALCQQHGDVS